MEINNMKFCFVAILGAPNAGKSTLVNRLIGSKVSIVSPKVQTTRSRIRGILVEENTQLVLVDTPGIFAASQRFERAMVASAWTESDEADQRLLLIDAQKGLDKNTRAIISRLQSEKKKVVLVLNKIDLLPKSKLLHLLIKRSRPEPGRRSPSTNIFTNRVYFHILTTGGTKFISDTGNVHPSLAHIVLFVESSAPLKTTLAGIRKRLLSPVIWSGREQL